MSALHGKICRKPMWRSYSSTPCGKPARVERDGKFYCGIHDPEKIAARRARTAAIYEAQDRVRRANAEHSRLTTKLADWALAHMPADHELRRDVNRSEAETADAREALEALEARK